MPSRQLDQDVAFERRRRAFVERLGRLGVGGLESGTIVVLQSLSFPITELRKIVGITHYEERMLCMLLLLRDPAVRVVYVTSMPVDPAVVDYYLGFVDVPGARDRLHMISAGVPGPRPLSEKLLDAPGALEAIRAAAAGADDAYLLPFNVTALEDEIARRLGIPLYGPALELVDLGSKSGSRRVARAARIPVFTGAEDLRSRAAVAVAVDALRVARPDAPALVIKLNNGFSGQGNAIVALDAGRPRLDDSDTLFCASEESWASYGVKLAAEGGIVEELVQVPGVTSPSVQMRIAPGGDYEVVSTHDQVLGPPNDQVYLGCTFPARASYRAEICDRARAVARVLAGEGVIGSFGLDFVVVPGDDIYLSEINLRLGGTTHPFWMARLATKGSYDQDTGELFASGVPRYYMATDNLKSPTYVGLDPDAVIDALARQGLLFDGADATGATLHLLGAVTEHGKLGVTCIAESPDASGRLYAEVMAELGRIRA